MSSWLCLLPILTITLGDLKVSVPFQSINGSGSHKFKSPVFMGTCQSVLSSLSALFYLLLRRKPNETVVQTLGLSPLSPVANGVTRDAVDGSAQANGYAKHPSPPTSTKVLLLRYLQCSLFITFAAPFGFAALSHISYPAMVLGKSCKLVPVMLMNVLLYRRAFARHKYVVVALVTIGITMFMGFGGEGARKHSHGRRGDTHPTLTHSTIGIAYL